MGLRDKLRGLASMATTPTSVALPGGKRTEVVGESFHVSAFEAICGPRKPEGEDRRVVAQLVWEPKNKYDPNAIAVVVDGHIVGHLKREMAANYRPVMEAAKAKRVGCQVTAWITHGWRRPDGDTGDYCVTLDLGSVNACTNAIRDGS